MEIWKPVSGVEGLYKVSDLGRCRRIARGKGAKVGRILKPFTRKDGYAAYTIRRNGHNAGYLAHCMVADAFIGPRSRGLELNHKNGIKADNRLCNLEVVTRSENISHAFRVLKTQIARPENLGPPEARRGELNGVARLTEQKVQDIFKMRSHGVSLRKIAHAMEVGKTTIGHVLARRTWGHVTVDCVT